MRSIEGLILTVQHCSTHRKPCPSPSFFTTFPSWTGLGTWACWWAVGSSVLNHGTVLCTLLI